MKATVEVVTTLELDTDEAVVQQLMSSDWQDSFYHFPSREDAMAWLAWAVHTFDGPDHVDGLADIGRVSVRETATEMMVLDQEP
jgi:hypothetical protein